MKDEELIRKLRVFGNAIYHPELKNIMSKAADRIEELSERVAIMQSDMDQTWGESYCTATGAAVHENRAGMTDTAP